MYRLQPEEDVHIEGELEREEAKTGESTATHTQKRTIYCQGITPS